MDIKIKLTRPDFEYRGRVISRKDLQLVGIWRRDDKIPGLMRYDGNGGQNVLYSEYIISSRVLINNVYCYKLIAGPNTQEIYVSVNQVCRTLKHTE